MRVTSRLFHASITVALVATRPAWAAWPEDPGANVPVFAPITYCQRLHLRAFGDGQGGALLFVRSDACSQTSDPWVGRRVGGDGTVSWPAAGTPVFDTQEYVYTWDGSAGIVSDGAGGATAAWARSTTGVIHTNIDAAGVRNAADDDTLFGGAPALSLNAAAGDGAGGMVLVWQALSGLRAQHVTASGTELWPAGGVLLDTYGTFVEALFEPDGHALFVWNRETLSGRSSIVAQRVAPNGALRWGAAGIELCDTMSTQNPPDLCWSEVECDGQASCVPDGEGGLLAAWFDERPGEDPGIRAQRVDSTGALRWGPAGIRVAASARRFPHVASDAAGGLIVAWDDEQDVFAQRLGPDGNPLWDAGGLSICGAPGAQTEPAVAADGLGGAYIAWTDARGADLDIYGQQIDANGERQWLADGAPVSTAAGDQRQPLVAASAPDGAIAFWVDDGRSGVYAQWIPISAVVPVQLSLVEADASSGRVRLKWFTAGNGASEFTLERREGAPGWSRIAALHADGAGYVRFDDDIVNPGTTYFYRLGWWESGAARYADPVRVEVPMPLSFTIESLAPNPTRVPAVRFALDAPGIARLDVFDVSGRLRLGRRLELPAGRHTIRLDEAEGLPAGIYWLQLTHRGRTLQRSFVLKK